MRKRNRNESLVERFPPSGKCQCEICVSFCNRPGWWSVDQARLAVKAGYSSRMMLEVSPELTFGVLSPAFKGCEGLFSLQCYSKNKCTFFIKDLCELHTSGLVPLECQFCHHSRPGLGPHCHHALENDWKTKAGQSLVEQWTKMFHLWDTFRKIVKADGSNHLK